MLLSPQLRVCYSHRSSLPAGSCLTVCLHYPAQRGRSPASADTGGTRGRCIWSQLTCDSAHRWPRERIIHAELRNNCLSLWPRSHGRWQVVQGRNPSRRGRSVLMSVKWSGHTGGWLIPFEWKNKERSESPPNWGARIGDVTLPNPWNIKRAARSTGASRKTGTSD